MTQITYYVALPFVWVVDENSGEDDMRDVGPGEPVECESAEVAVALAASMAQEGLGAIAFSRSGDADTGVFEDAVVLAKFGSVGKVG